MQPLFPRPLYVIGSCVHTFATKDKIDLIANKTTKVEMVQGNRLLPILHDKQAYIDDLIIPWKDALLVKLLGKQIGYMKTHGRNCVDGCWECTLHGQV